MRDFNCCWKIPKKLTSTEEFGEEAIGIDLGTTRCCLAVSRKNGIQTAPIDNSGERLLPSYIGYDEKNIKCGRIVMNSLRNLFKSTVFDVKRIIGRKRSEIIIDPSWTFSLIFDENDDALIQTFHCEERINLSPINATADLLRSLKKSAEDFQGKLLDSVVITVPASFNARQSRDTVKAAFEAGWKVVHLLPEPVAAAFSYFIDRPNIPNNSNILLFDLGGGTLDVSVFKIANDEISFVKIEGDLNLGGRDFDNLLFKHFEEILLRNFQKAAIGGLKYKLLKECQKIKEDLSVRETEQLDEFDENIVIPITRNEFETLSAPLLSQIRDIIERASDGIPDINYVLLVGGGSRMPMVKALLQNMFPNSELLSQIHLDEAVAMGAAYHAYHLLTHPEASNNFRFEKDSESDFETDSVELDAQHFENIVEEASLPDDSIIFSFHQGPDEVASYRTMETTINITKNGEIHGKTTLEARHWIWGFRGGVKVQLFDEIGRCIWENNFEQFGVNMHSSSTRNLHNQIPQEVVGKIASASIIHKHAYEIP